MYVKASTAGNHILRFFEQPLQNSFHLQALRRPRLRPCPLRHLFIFYNKYNAVLLYYLFNIIFVKLVLPNRYAEPAVLLSTESI